MYIQNKFTKHIIEVGSRQIVNAYNIYQAVYTLENIYGETDQLQLYNNESDYLVDEFGRLINFDSFQSHGSSHVFSNRYDWYDEDGNEIIDFRTFPLDSIFFYHWNGHNFRAYMIWSDTYNDDVEYEEINFNPDNFKYIGESGLQNGRNQQLFIDESEQKYWIFTTTAWQGEFDFWMENDTDEDDIIRDILQKEGFNNE